jgi:ribosomal protein L11 methyltransferase
VTPDSPAAAAAWWRLELAIPPELEESLLWKLESLGIRRLAVHHRPEAPGARELVGWLPQLDWPAERREVLAAELALLGEPFGCALPPLRWQRQEEEDWNASWKRHWRPDPVGERLLILPAWLEPPAEHASRRSLRLDPDCAFGSGSHPTTRLCLEGLERLASARAGGLDGLRVADLGCGSGILALAALELGAAAAAAVDSDPVAVRATLANGALNGPAVAARLRVAEGSVAALAALQDAPADLLLCNILASVIEVLVPEFQTVLAAAGEALLSGLLVRQAPRLERVLAEHGWRGELAASQENWGLMHVRRAATVA